MAAVEASEARSRELGFDPAEARLVLSMPKRSEPKNYDRAQVVPGLFGRCVGWTGDGNIYMFDIKCADIRAYVERRGGVLP
jgi:hypothetical protein